MIVSDLLTEKRILPDLVAGSKAEVLAELSALMEDSVPEVDGPGILEVIQEREDVSSTAIGNGVALPHGRLAGLQRVLVGFARSRQGINFDSLDGGSTHLFFILLAPEDSAAQHLKALAGLSRLLADDAFRRVLLEAPGDDLLGLIRERDGEA
jgi:PTS system nitrogen regulatory IIA component